MAGNEHIDNRNRWIGALLFSLCLHLLLILSCPHWSDLFLSNPHVEESDKVITFDIIQPSEPRGRLVETNEASAVPPDRANLLSDKHSIARDMNPSSQLDNQMPYMDGQVALGAIQPPPEYNTNRSNEDARQGDQSNDFKPDGFHVRKSTKSSTSSFNREKLLGIQQPSQARVPEPAYKELKSSVDASGGVSFNTYAWEWAPYMLKLKQIIQKNIFPPASFTRLGFGGDHLIRFRIARNGGLTGPSVLGHDGDKELIQTSTNSITLSAPFPPLPEEFPEKYLEVTVQFYYYGKESY